MNDSQIRNQLNALLNKTPPQTEAVESAEFKSIAQTAADELDVISCELEGITPINLPLERLQKFNTAKSLLSKAARALRKSIKV